MQRLPIHVAALLNKFIQITKIDAHLYHSSIIQKELYIYSDGDLSHWQ